jgi:hypothetical protein
MIAVTNQKMKVRVSNFGCSFRRMTKFSMPNVIKIDAQERGQAFGFSHHGIMSDLSHIPVPRLLLSSCFQR